MRSRAKEAIEHHECPESVTEQLRLAGGVNRFGGPMFRLVWGYDRIISMYGEWQEFEQFIVKITAVPSDIPVAMGEPIMPIPKELNVRAGDTQERLVTKLKSSIIETRQVPKYMPGNCWHLEMWRPPEEYGTPEAWREAGEEVLGLMTIDTAGEYPALGEYELCYPLTSDGTSSGKPIPLVSEVVTEIVRMVVVSRDRFTLQQRRSAIEQRLAREEEGFVRVAEDQLKDGLRPFAGESFIVKP